MAEVQSELAKTISSGAKLRRVKGKSPAKAGPPPAAAVDKEDAEGGEAKGEGSEPLRAPLKKQWSGIGKLFAEGASRMRTAGGEPTPEQEEEDDDWSDTNNTPPKPTASASLAVDQQEYASPQFQETPHESQPSAVVYDGEEGDEDQEDVTAVHHHDGYDHDHSGGEDQDWAQGAQPHLLSASTSYQRIRAPSNPITAATRSGTFSDLRRPSRLVRTHSMGQRPPAVPNAPQPLARHNTVTDPAMMQRTGEGGGPVPQRNPRKSLFSMVRQAQTMYKGFGRRERGLTSNWNPATAGSSGGEETPQPAVFRRLSSSSKPSDFSSNPVAPPMGLDG